MDTQKDNNNSPEEIIHSVIRKLSKLNYVKPTDLPNIDLYMDQITTFMDSHLSDIKRNNDDKILTKTMINNYSKNKILPPSDKKKYSKDHIIVLLFIYYFKNIMSITDIQTLLWPLTENFFDNKKSLNLEEIYKTVFKLETKQIADIARSISKQFKLSEESFKDIKDDDEREYLQLFSFICLLSFDIFIKKYMIESLLDDYISKKEKKTKEDKKAEKKKEK
ncbi:MAG TPA: hypothetical protein DEO82_00145 [Eubacterium sp.]|nr:hypothetical protein [Eubacterium sp.]